MLALGAGMTLSRHIEATCVRVGYVECVGSVEDFMGEVSLAQPAVAHSWNIVLWDNTNTVMCLLYLLMRQVNFLR